MATRCSGYQPATGIDVTGWAYSRWANSTVACFFGRLSTATAAGSISAGGDLGLILNFILTMIVVGASTLLSATMSTVQPAASPVSGEVVFKTSESTGSLTERLRVKATGIDVTGSVTADGLTVSNSSLQVKLEEADGTYNPRLVTYFDASGTHLQHTWSSGAANFIFEAGGAEGSGTERMRIDGDTGNVGIGTSSPSHKLSVSGSNSAARFSDDGTGYNLDIEHDTTNGIASKINQTRNSGA